MNQRRRVLAISAFLLMLTSAFIDNLRGSLIPLLHEQLNLGFAMVGGMMLSVAGLAGAFFNTRLLTVERRAGVRGLILFAVGLIMVAMVLATQVTGIISLGLMAIPLGGAIASMGTISNLLLVMSSDTGKSLASDASLDARSAHRAKMMAGLHLMFGVGSLLAPAVAAFAINRHWPWPWIIALPLPLLAAPLFWTIRMDSSHSSHTPKSGSDKISGLPPAPMAESMWHNISRAEWFIVAIFLAYVTGEVLTSMWMPSFLMAHFGLTYENANQTSAGFFVVFSMARLAVVILVREKFHKPFIYVPLLIAAVAMIGASLFSQPGEADSALIFLFPAAGIIGPFFPMMLARVSVIYNHSWQRLTVVILTTMQVALALSHLVLGTIFDQLGAQRAYLIPPVLLIFAGVGAWKFLRLAPNLR